MEIMKLEKMNQVSVTEFMSKSKEEMYDMAVEMVEKYNRLVDICNDSAERIADLVIERDNLVERRKVYTSALNKDLADKANKIELLEKEIESLVEVRNNLEKEIEAHEEENKRLSEKIMELNGEVNKLNRFLKMQEDLTRDWKNKYVEAQKEIDEWESDTGEHETIIQYQEFIDGLNKDLSYWKGAFETQATSLAEVRKCNDDLVDTLNKSSDRVEELEKQVKYLEKELNETCTCKELDLKGHNRREMALVNELADKNDEIKKLEESIDYYKNQERIRTDQLRATESKVDELWKRIKDLEEELTRAWKNKYTGLNKEDDHGKSGFKRYIEHLIEEEERAVPERFKERLNKEITEIFTKEEETEVKGNGRTSSGRYPWGAKVNDIPCGEDSIE